MLNKYLLNTLIDLARFLDSAADKTINESTFTVFVISRVFVTIDYEFYNVVIENEYSTTIVDFSLVDVLSDIHECRQEVLSKLGEYINV